MASIRQGATSLRGNPIDVTGEELKVGQKAPDFTLVGQDMSSVSLNDTTGKVRVAIEVVLVGRNRTELTLVSTAPNVAQKVVDRAIQLSRDKYCSVWQSMRQDIAFTTTVSLGKVG